MSINHEESRALQKSAQRLAEVSRDLAKVAAGQKIAELDPMPMSIEQAESQSHSTYGDQSKNSDFYPKGKEPEDLETTVTGSTKRANIDWENAYAGAEDALLEKFDAAETKARQYASAAEVAEEEGDDTKAASLKRKAAGFLKLAKDISEVHEEAFNEGFRSVADVERETSIPGGLEEVSDITLDDGRSAGNDNLGHGQPLEEGGHRTRFGPASPHDATGAGEGGSPQAQPRTSSSKPGRAASMDYIAAARRAKLMA